MIRWRLFLAAVLALVVGVPLAAPLGEVLQHPRAWTAWSEAERLAGLAGNSLLLVGGTLLLAFPAGVVAAFLLYRTDLPGRRLFRFLAILTLFVPLPVFASGWQATFGSGGWWPLGLWNNPASPAVWSPWGYGLWSATWIHAVAALPWVIVLAGLGLCWVERDLEEDALLAAPPWRVVLRVTLPRSRAALAAAALWVVLHAGTEITVTDMVKLRTFAEEVYTQFVSPEPSLPGESAPAVLARAVVVALPAVLITAALVVVAGRAWERTLPALRERQPPLEFSLGYLRWPIATAAAVVAVGLLGVPLLSLVEKVGRTGYPPAWSAATAWAHLRTVAVTHGPTALTSALAALVTGVIAASLALAACWLALGRRGWLTGLLVLAAAAWAMPGPIVGLGVNAACRGLLDLTGSDVLGRLVYHGPSYLPPVWACGVRFFGCALAVLWPVVRLLPRDLLDSARVEGATPGQELRHVVWPLTRRAWWCAVGVVAVLTLGELAASKLAATPGAPMLSHELFALMHTGVTNDLAALCLLVLLLAGGGGVGVWLIGRHFREAADAV